MVTLYSVTFLMQSICQFVDSMHMSENHTLYKVEEKKRKKYVNKSWHKKKKKNKKKNHSG